MAWIILALVALIVVLALIGLVVDKNARNNRGGDGHSTGHPVYDDQDDGD